LSASTVHHRFRHQRHVIETHTRGILNRIQDRRAAPSIGNSPIPFAPAGP
jgi:hypothetical protein